MPVQNEAIINLQKDQLTQRAPDSRQSAPGHEGGSRRTPCGQSGSFRGLRLVPRKWRCLVPPSGGYPHPQGAAQGCSANASR